MCAWAGGRKLATSGDSGKQVSVEWPTVALAAGIYSGWVALTYFHAAMPAPLVAAIGAWLITWHSSLQHEIVHYHPTRWPWLNTVIGFAPLSLWLPYARFPMTHLVHHRDEALTDPLDDPESFYLTPAQWHERSLATRALLTAQTTLLGRMTLGPAWTVSRFLIGEARGIAAGDGRRARIWAVHLAGVAAILYWLVAICDRNLGFYVAAFVYPGTALLLVRSFAEHRAALDVRQRIAIVENAWILGPLFLFNNLHAAHHERPDIAWYKLPGWYRANRERLIRANGGLVYDGYGEVVRRFLITPHDTPIHPLGRIMPAVQPGS
jgi:fatty acid desaturase